MRTLVLGSALAVGIVSLCSAETPAPSKPTPEQVWQAAMSRKLMQSAALERRTCRRHCPVGRTLVSFTVHRDGTLTDIHVATGSGSAGMDESVLRAVRKASPLPPIPPEIAEDARPINVPIRFSK